MKMAIEDAELETRNIDLINAHGTSTVINDLMESKAIKKVFESDNPDVMIQSSKSMLLVRQL